MKKLKTLSIYISSYRIWVLILLGIDLFFAFLIWAVCPNNFVSYIGLILLVLFLVIVIPLNISIRKYHKADIIFKNFLSDPSEVNEYLLTETVPIVFHSYINELGNHLRKQQENLNDQKVKVSDFESYIENWVHEIKKPVSLMTLLLDNRKNEMSNMVHQRMLYVRDQTRQDIEQILYFSRLGATHKDYYFEKISLKSICQESIEDNRTLLEEAGFSINYSGNENVVVSDKKGLMFILGQVISNSVKYSTKKEIPILSFSIMESQNEENILLSISDNGSNIPESDIPFVFDKGFTGNTGSYLSRSTGMGLYLVRKMANDLSIDVEIKNNSYGGVTIILFFPKVKNSLRR